MENVRSQTLSIDAVPVDSGAREMGVMAMFMAIVLLMAFTPFGIIDLPLIKATILHVPVIIGALFLGPKKGAGLGFLFGLTSFIKNTMHPSILSFAFTPAVPVPGLGRGSFWAILICFLPRMLVGVMPFLFYHFAEGLLLKKPVPAKGIVRAAILSLCGAIGAITNTALVMGMIYFVFRDAYAAANGIPVSTVLSVILSVVFANGIPEMLVAAILVPAVSLPLFRANVYLRKD